MNDDFCDSCKKRVITFNQHVITMPQGAGNDKRHYLETFCSYCGNCIHREVIDTKGEENIRKDVN